MTYLPSIFITLEVDREDESLAPQTTILKDVGILLDQLNMIGSIMSCEV